jgi:hypothetical protein
MSDKSCEDDNRTSRITELTAALFSLNDALFERLGQVGSVEKALMDRLLSGDLSLNPKAVDGYKLADRTLARSLRVNIRIHQRSALYLSMRKRAITELLESLGADPNSLEREWSDRRFMLGSQEVEESDSESDDTALNSEVS